MDYPKKSPGKSWDLLIFFEKSWKSPGINEASKYPGKLERVLESPVFSIDFFCGNPARARACHIFLQI